MIEILFMVVYLSGACIWVITHGARAADSVTDARLRPTYQSDAKLHAREALHHLKALALAPVWPVALLLSARSLLREMQEIAREGDEA